MQQLSEYIIVCTHLRMNLIHSMTIVMSTHTSQTIYIQSMTLIRLLWPAAQAAMKTGCANTDHTEGSMLQVETSAMWDYGNQRSQEPNPVTYTQGLPGHGPTHIDLKYKVI